MHLPNCPIPQIRPALPILSKIEKFGNIPNCKFQFFDIKYKVIGIVCVNGTGSPIPKVSFQETEENDIAMVAFLQ